MIRAGVLVQNLTAVDDIELSDIQIDYQYRECCYCLQQKQDVHPIRTCPIQNFVYGITQ